MLFKIFILNVLDSSMKIAIHQPKLLPHWILQLIYAVDTFVIYDDVNFVKDHLLITILF